jgi:hypothetical protein
MQQALFCRDGSRDFSWGFTSKALVGFENRWQAFSAFLSETRLRVNDNFALLLFLNDSCKSWTRMAVLRLETDAIDMHGIGSASQERSKSRSVSILGYRAGGQQRRVRCSSIGDDSQPQGIIICPRHGVTPEKTERPSPGRGRPRENRLPPALAGQ